MYGSERVKHVEMEKYGAKMVWQWQKDGVEALFCHLCTIFVLSFVISLCLKRGFSKKYYFVQTLQESLSIYANYSFGMEPPFKAIVALGKLVP